MFGVIVAYIWPFWDLHAKALIHWLNQGFRPLGLLLKGRN